MFRRKKQLTIPAPDGTEDITELRTEDSIEAFWIKPGISGIEIRRGENSAPQYLLCEPKLSQFEEELLSVLIKTVREVLAKKKDAAYTAEELQKTADEILAGMKIPLENSTVQKLRYYLETTIFGWGKLELLRHDKDIEDISCVGADYPVYLYHRRYRDMETNIRFGSAEELNHAVTLFAQKAGKQLSLAQPIVDGTLPDGSRIQMTYGSAVSSRGSSFTIRKFRDTPYSVIDLLKNRTFTVLEMVYLWFAVEYNHSILIIGGTASGKTTTLNALSQFIPPLAKIVTIEDTRELMLCHGNWHPTVVPPSGDGKAITLFDLVSAAMRQRPEYLIVGEVRGEETSAMFQAINTGHTSLSTFHAGNFRNAVNRLQSSPLNIPRAMIESLDIVLSQKRILKDGAQIRRCSEIVEITGSTGEQELQTNTVFSYRETDDSAVVCRDAKIYADILSQTGMGADALAAEIERRISLLTRMVQEDITDFRRVSEMIDAYMTERTGEP